ncbi:MAG: hypothetical protein K2G74_01330, partial [Muribaculaceae bacterium]|nr:hypothetical protein [Muribaculaceae bacterium]
QYIDHKGISIAAFERSVSMSNASFGKSLKNGGAIGSDKLENILNIYKDLSPTWLLTGDGDMILDRDSSDATYSSVDTGIPLIPVEAMAGYLSGEVSVLESDCERLNIPGLKADFVIPVSGDSMEPKYFSGDLVACQYVNLNDLFFQWGKVYVIDTNQGVLLKKVKKADLPQNIMLISENPNYDPVIMPRENIFHIALVKGLVRIV